MSKKLTTEEFVNRSKLIHGGKYDYSRVIYLRASDKVEIGCSKHGYFNQRASNHLRGLGCYKCSEKSNIGMFKSWGDRLLEIKKIHGDKYTYPNNNDVGAFDFIEINCIKHGLFKQRLHDHLRGKGCRACGGGSNFRRSSYIDKCNKNHDGMSNFYILKIRENNGFCFYKIGITVQELNQRYSNSVMPYKYEVVREIKAKALDVFDTELKLKSILSGHRYSPLVKFSGSRYECFSQITENAMMIVNELELESVKTNWKT